MAIRFRRVSRLCDPTNKELGKKVYPVISYQYDTSATLKEIAKEISSNSGVSEGETISVLKDFRTLLRKTLLAGRSVNIEGLGYFFLSAQSKGTEKAEDFTSADIQGLRICFRANSDIRLCIGNYGGSLPCRFAQRSKKQAGKDYCRLHLRRSAGYRRRPEGAGSHDSAAERRAEAQSGTDA